MLVTDEYTNYRKKANKMITEMRQIINRQREKEKELNKNMGLSPLMSQLMSTLTTQNEKRYNKIADTFPDYKTPSSSSMSTPEQTTGQRATSNMRLDVMCSVPPPKRLQFLN